MVREYEHLNLPKVDDVFSRKKKPGGGGYSLTKRNYGKFKDEQVSTLNNLAKKFEKEKEAFRDYSQELVMKVKTNQEVHDASFRDELRRAGCDTLISEKGKQSEWIVSATDTDFKKLKKKLTRRIEKVKADFIDSIEYFQDFSYDDKKGPLLKKNPLGRIEVNKIVLSLIHKESDIENEKINSAIDLIVQMASEEGFQVHDKLITANVCLVLLECNENFLKKISSLDIISKIDRPAQFELEQDFSKDLEDVGENTPPTESNHGILVMDSGIRLHPLLVDAVDNPDGIVGLPDRNTSDDRIHGTKVAGIALHGDIQQKIHQGFNSEVWIYSAKIFYQNGRNIIYDNDRLLESNIKTNVEEILRKYPKCRIINFSFGYQDHVLENNSRQFDLATLVDDLSLQYKENDIIFVISAGNISENYYRENQYPDYLLSEDKEVRIINPATSAHAFTVGALQDFDSSFNQPSTITRVGPGLNEMVKPELVESGGGFDGEITLLNQDYQQRLFTKGMGTSYSAPKIAHYLALLFNKYPQHHRNLIKCFILSSTGFPSERPDIFPKLNSNTKGTELQSLLNIYGYGKPEIQKALSTTDDRVVFKFEGDMKLNQVRYFTINLPENFVTEKGKRFLSVSLVYDPPIRQTRADYFGVGMEFHLFKNISLDDVMEKLNEVNLDEDITDEEVGRTPADLQKFEIILKPGVKIRKKTPHQHGKRVLATASKLDNSFPLVLAVISQKKWEFPESFKQNFAIVVTLEHEKNMDLYNQIRIENNIGVQAQIRV